MMLEHLKQRSLNPNLYSGVWLGEEENTVTFGMWNLSGQLVGFQQYRPLAGKGRGGDYPNKPYPQKDYVWDCLVAAVEVDTKEISTRLLEAGKSGIQIGEAIRVARIDAIRKIKRPEV